MANIVQYIIDFATRGGNAVVRQAAQLQGRLDAADRSANRLVMSVGKNLKEAFMSLPGASFFSNPIVAMTAGIGVVSRLGMQAETTATSFEVMLGSQRRSVEMLDRINEYAKLSPYDRLGAQEAAKTMLGFGVAADTVVNDLKMLGDIAGGDNQRLRQLALVFGQISAAGRLQGQDLLQLINAGYNPLQDISEMTGKSMEQLREEMSKGAIGIDMVRAAFIRATSEGGRYYGMIDKLAESPAGKFGAMKDTATEALLAIYNVIQPLIIPALETVTSILNAVTPIINAVAKPVQWIFNLFREGNPLVLAATAGIGAYTAAMVVNTTVLKGWKIAELAHYAALLLVEKAQWLLNAAMSANPIGLIIAGIAALVAAIVVCWNKFAGFRAVILTVWDTMKGFAGAIKDLLISRITSLLQGIGKVGQALAKLFTGDFSGAWQTAKEAGLLLMNVEGKKQAFADMRSVVSGIGTNYTSRLEEERQKQKAKDAISDPEAAAGTGNGKDAGHNPGMYGTDPAQKVANEVTAGGTRNTQITLTIGNLMNDVRISATGIRETGEEIRKTVLEAINRALETSISAAR